MTGPGWRAPRCDWLIPALTHRPARPPNPRPTLSRVFQLFVVATRLRLHPGSVCAPGYPLLQCAAREIRSNEEDRCGRRSRRLRSAMQRARMAKRPARWGKNANGAPAPPIHTHARFGRREEGVDGWRLGLWRLVHNTPAVPQHGIEPNLTACSVQRLVVHGGARQRLGARILHASHAKPQINKASSNRKACANRSHLVGCGGVAPGPAVGSWVKGSRTCSSSGSDIGTLPRVADWYTAVATCADAFATIRETTASAGAAMASCRQGRRSHLERGADVGARDPSSSASSPSGVSSTRIMLLRSDSQIAGHLETTLLGQSRAHRMEPVR